MRGTVLALAAASAIALSATAANATTTTVVHVGTTVTGTDGGTRSFYASPAGGGAIEGTINAGPAALPFNLGSYIGAGTFEDIYQFFVPLNGTGSGSLTSSISVTGIGGALDTDITNVWIVTGAGTFNATQNSSGGVEQWGADNIPLIGGVLNSLYVDGLSRGKGHYQADLTYQPVPEPATWAMMLMGFLGVGAVMTRRRRKQNHLLQLA